MTGEVEIGEPFDADAEAQRDDRPLTREVTVAGHRLLTGPETDVGRANDSFAEQIEQVVDAGHQVVVGIHERGRTSMAVALIDDDAITLLDCFTRDLREYAASLDQTPAATILELATGERDVADAQDWVDADTAR